MNGHNQQQTDWLCEEIAGLARRHLEAPGHLGMHDIEAQIQYATAESRWDDVSKWHRVKLRYLRFRQQREVARTMQAWA